MTAPRARPVLVVTHGRVGEELVALARELLGALPELESLPITSRDSLDHVSGKMQNWADRLPSGSRGLILTDLKNSSASVCALGLAKNYSVDCICGVNLPLLLKSISPGGAAPEEILAAGRQGIGVMSILRSPQKRKRKRGEAE